LNGTLQRPEKHFQQAADEMFVMDACCLDCIINVFEKTQQAHAVYHEQLVIAGSIMAVSAIMIEPDSQTATALTEENAVTKPLRVILDLSQSHCAAAARHT